MDPADEYMMITAGIILGALTVIVLVYLMSGQKKTNKSPFIPNYNFL